MKEYLFGLIDSEYTDNDYMYENICGIGKTELPTRFISKHLMVKDQKNTMKCVGFSTSSLMEVREMMTKNTVIVPELSPQFGYYVAKTLDGLSSNVTGTTLKAVSDAMKKYGICEEKYCRFEHDNSLLSGMTKPSQEAYDDAKQRKIDGYARITTLDAIKKAVYTEGVCLISMAYFGGMLDCPNGYMAKPSMNASKLGNHCKIVIGYDDEHEETIGGVKYKGFFVQLNSYGIDQGRFGLEYVPYDMMNWVGGRYQYTIDKIFREAYVFYDDTNVDNKKFHIQNQPNTVIESIKKINMEFTMNSKEAVIDGKSVTMDVAPLCIDGSNFLPFRFIFEQMGMSVNYTKQPDGHDTITGTDKVTGSKVSLNIGRTVAYTNGQQYIMYRAPFIKDGRTYVPVRAVAEMSGCTVNYDNTTKKITIKR